MKVIKVHILELAEAPGRVGCSEVDLKPFYILRVLALIVGLYRHEHDISKCTSHGSNNICSFQVHTYMRVNSDSRNTITNNVFGTVIVGTSSPISQ